MLIVGDKEKVQRKVAVRSWQNGDEGMVSLAELLARFEKEAKSFD